ncbi:PREDICTED: dentin sialophosphoprotein [Bactrocera latifrons]|uniref:dentin sialophosphoprotein n=1 Tax=Bactrocera latifrons TaxID=174628 RepID=UPI0008DE9B1D|nr:PREDICTED: dentin sialophosphoprotein [Bactrocera latifrons]
MDDAELTRLAIAEIVREMGEIKEPDVQERKINPIAKPNKRFLGRTLNSVLSHNKRKNDRTQENCRRKLKELDERREKINRLNSRSRSGSLELVLSSSSDEHDSKKVRKQKQHDRKLRNNKHKKLKKRKHKSKKKRRARSSSGSSSDESSSENSCNTSSSTCRSKKSKLRKKSKSKKCKVLQTEKNTNEFDTEEVYYEPDINAAMEFGAAMEFDAALMANNYRHHQMQQLLYYNALMAGHQATEIEALKEELQISDAEVTETQKEKASICSAVSSLNLNESDSDGSEMLQISLSSATSSSSETKGDKSIKNKKVKRKDLEERIPSDSSDAVIWELDSDSSNGDKMSDIKGGSEKQTENEDCVCITSESETSTGDDSESESSTNEEDSASANVTNANNNVCHAEPETVTLLSSSDSEVEIINMNGADESVQQLTDSVMAATTTQPTDSTPALVQQMSLVLPVPETNSISLPKDSLSTVIDDLVVTVPDKASNLSVEVDSLVTATECLSPPIKVDEAGSVTPICIVQEQQDSMKETDKLEATNSTSLTFIAPASRITEALRKTNSSEVTTADKDIQTAALKLKIDSLEADDRKSLTVEAPNHPITDAQCGSSSSAMTTADTDVGTTTLNFDSLKASNSTPLTFVTSTNPNTEERCEMNSSGMTTVGTHVEALESISEIGLSNKVANVALKESVDEIPTNASTSSPTDRSVSSMPTLSPLIPQSTIGNTELHLVQIQNQWEITESETVNEQMS